jgi:hypothetical protein
MPEFLKTTFAGPSVHPLEVLVRLIIAALLGSVVAWIYRRTRKSTDLIASFPTTLVLLAILIAMVTQVIGDNVARAFSLVGALSIVRFRTVVRDTQDTAYVIFSVVVGMAVGAQNHWVGIVGLVVVGAAAFVMMRRSDAAPDAQPAFLLTLRLAIGHDLDALLQVLDRFVQARDLLSIATAKQGVSIDVTYETRLRPHASPNELVKTLNKIEGVQNVQIERRTLDRD